MDFESRAFAGLVETLVIAGLGHLAQVRIAHRSLVVAPSARGAAGACGLVVPGLAAGPWQLDIASAIGLFLRTGGVGIIAFLRRHARPVIGLLRASGLVGLACFGFNLCLRL